MRSNHNAIKIAAIIIFFLIGVSQGFPRKLTSFPDMLKAEMVRVKQDRIFVTHEATVSIYSLADFKLIKKFGKKGEGPREFVINPPDNPLKIEILPDYILVNSVRKISYFTLDGEFVKEERNPHGNFLQPIGKNYVGEVFLEDSGTVYRVINLYGPDLKKIREVYRQKHILQGGQGIVIGREVPKFQVFKDKIFISGKTGFVIDIYDKEGKLVHTIRQEYEKRKVTNDDKKAIHDMLQKEYKEIYARLRDRIKIVDYFPVIRDFFVDKKNFYISTNKEKDGKLEIFISDADGKSLKRVFLPVLKENPLRAFPYDFYNGKLYQIIENDKTEEWELHVTELK